MKYFLLAVILLLIVSCAREVEPEPTNTLQPTVTNTPVPPDTPEPTATPLPTATTEVVMITVEVETFLEGRWEGNIDIDGVLLKVIVEFMTGDDGLMATIDIPQQGQVGLPLDNVTRDGNQVHFEIGSVAANFDGTIGGDVISGDFEQSGVTGIFTLVPAREIVVDDTPDEPPPYTVMEVAWTLGDTMVDATLTIPEGDGPFPAVVFVAGSGPTDRDWNSPLIPGTNGSAALLADELTRAGHVTLRYDKRVSGVNATANVPKLVGQLSMQSHLDELAGGVEYLVNLPEVDSTQISVLANSEGTIHALNYQRSDPSTPFATLILAAPPGQSLADLILTQLEPQLAGTLDPVGMLTLVEQSIDAFLAGDPIAPSPDLPEPIQQLLLSLEAPANLPFTRELFAIDPAPWLAETTVSVLVLIGKKDIQVDWQADGALLEAAAGENVVFVYPEHANHVLKYEVKSADQLTPADGATYNSADRILDEESLINILTWLHQNR